MRYVNEPLMQIKEKPVEETRHLVRQSANKINRYTRRFSSGALEWHTNRLGDISAIDWRPFHHRVMDG